MQSGIGVAASGGMKHAPHSIFLAGAAPDTGNHGVTALGLSAAVGLLERDASPITMLDNGRGLRRDHDLARPFHVDRLGFRPGRNFFSPDTMLYEDGCTASCGSRHAARQSGFGCQWRR